MLWVDSRDRSRQAGLVGVELKCTAGELVGNGLGKLPTVRCGAVMEGTIWRLCQCLAQAGFVKSRLRQVRERGRSGLNLPTNYDTV
jgi:hypothetical protein